MPGIWRERFRSLNPIAHILQAQITHEREMSEVAAKQAAAELADRALMRAYRCSAYRSPENMLSKQDVLTPNTSIITTKANLRENFPAYKPETLGMRMPRLSAASSGSTGTPLLVERSVIDSTREEAFQRWWRGNYANCENSRVTILRGGFPRAFADGALHLGSTSERVLMLNSFKVGLGTAHTFVQLLRRHRTQVLFAYPSAIGELARAIEAMKLEAPVIPLVVTSSETLARGSARVHAGRPSTGSLRGCYQ